MTSCLHFKIRFGNHCTRKEENWHCSLIQDMYIAFPLGKSFLDNATLHAYGTGSVIKNRNFRTAFPYIVIWQLRPGADPKSLRPERSL